MGGCIATFLLNLGRIAVQPPLHMMSFLWCHQESNRGRKGKNSRIQSFALLTQKKTSS